MCIFILRISENTICKIWANIFSICLFVCFSDCHLREYQIQESEAVKHIDTIGLARKETEVVRKIIFF